MLNSKFIHAALITASLICMGATTGSNNFSILSDPQSDTTRIASDTMLVSDNNAFPDSTMELARTKVRRLPIGLNKHVEKHVREYLKENDFFLAKIKATSAQSFAIIDAVFQEQTIPVELKYLAVIESKLNPHAVSSAGAVGLWQLMPVPAKQFGLKISKGNDERKNAHKSTVAAAKCLGYLYRMFDDWLLTLAAYNSGPGRVLSAIKKAASRDYWTLQQFLPAETRKHVRKFISIHYYFEGQGSVVTMTKKERLKYIQLTIDTAEVEVVKGF